MGKKSLLELLAIWTVTISLPSALGQRPVGDEAVISSGTLNLVLANRNGFVIAADSRRSALNSFSCTDGTPAKRARDIGYFYCDDSQKLFRTGTHSAMAINGFAVGGYSRLQLAVASVLRKRFGPHGIADNRGGVTMVGDWSSWALEQALVGVAALYDPPDLPESSMVFGATYAGFDTDGHPILRQQAFRGSWKPSPLPDKPVPEYTISDSHNVLVNRFIPVAAGIPHVANAILKEFIAVPTQLSSPITRSVAQERWMKVRFQK